MSDLHKFIQQMPKVELHVHLEGAIQPATLLKLAQRHGRILPAETEEGLRRWLTFTDFPHFVDIYRTISACVQTAEDIELVTREFLTAQAAQHILYSEVTYTPFTHFQQKGIPFEEQLAAIKQARAWAKSALNVDMRLIIDMDRALSAEHGLTVAQWAIQALHNGVVALGLGGNEAGNPPEKFQAAFDLAHAAGVPAVIHAGETVGAESIAGALRHLRAVRIGHGVRCMENPALVEELRDRQTLLEVSPTSNICLGVFPSLADHPLPKMLEAGLNVCINTDDPAMFNTTLTQEYEKCATAFGWDTARLQQLVVNAVNAALLPEDEKHALRERVTKGFTKLLNTATVPYAEAIVVEHSAYDIRRLKDDLYLVTWRVMPSLAIADEFVKDLSKLFNTVDRKISILSDLRRGYIKEVVIIQKLAALTKHQHFAYATAFGSVGAQVYTGVYQRIAERKGHEEDTWLTLPQALAYLEEQQPGLTAGIDWAAIAGTKG
jgi:adenosine deaminase